MNTSPTYILGRRVLMPPQILRGTKTDIYKKYCVRTKCHTVIPCKVEEELRHGVPMYIYYYPDDAILVEVLNEYTNRLYKVAVCSMHCLTWWARMVSKEQEASPHV